MFHHSHVMLHHRHEKLHHMPVMLHHRHENLYHMPVMLRHRHEKLHHMPVMLRHRHEKLHLMAEMEGGWGVVEKAVLVRVPLARVRPCKCEDPHNTGK